MCFCNTSRRAQVTWALTGSRQQPDHCDEVWRQQFKISKIRSIARACAATASYGVYISQFIRYARCCSYYDDFGYRHKLLVDRLLSQGYEVKRLRNSFKKFYGRYPDLIGKYQRSVKDMVADLFPD